MIDMLLDILRILLPVTVVFCAGVLCVVLMAWWSKRKKAPDSRRG